MGSGSYKDGTLLVSGVKVPITNLYKLCVDTALELGSWTKVTSHASMCMQYWPTISMFMRQVVKMMGPNSYAAEWTERACLCAPARCSVP